MASRRFLGVAGPLTATAEEVVTGDLPAFADRLRAQLDFPPAWANSPGTGFRAWQRRARAKVEELLGLYRRLDIPDVATIAAPRPMLLFAGEADAVHGGGRRGRARQDAYGMGVATGGDRLVTRTWPG